MRAVWRRSEGRQWKWKWQWGGAYRAGLMPDWRCEVLCLGSLGEAGLAGEMFRVARCRQKKGSRRKLLDAGVRAVVWRADGGALGSGDEVAAVLGRVSELVEGVVVVVQVEEAVVCDGRRCWLQCCRWMPAHVQES